MTAFNGESLTKYDNKIRTQIKRKIHTVVHNNKKASELPTGVEGEGNRGGERHPVNKIRRQVTKWK